ncbi:peptidase M50B-like-domain-containing protein [Hysterangium stoloniferum]|nr:peptidase M50B-like-domain-containing protein [Hysterangium stoloniferum]
MSALPRPIAPKATDTAAGSIQTSPNQAVVIYVVLVYITFVFAVWSAPVVRVVIMPFKLFTIGWHELCHAIMARTILRITIDPNLGGCTLVQGGHTPTVLTAGYVGSTLFGGVFILAGWDTLVAKICSFVIAFGLLCPLALVRDKLTILLTFVYEAILVGFWFADHGSALRWYCLFVGVINILYVVWDVLDEKFFKKRNDADTTQFGLLYPRIPAYVLVWAIFWIMFQLAALVGFLFIGIVSFRRTTEQMQAEAGKFLQS